MAVTPTKPRTATIVFESNGIHFTIIRPVHASEVPDADDIEAVLRLRRATFEALRAGLFGAGGISQPSDEITVAQGAQAANRTPQTIRNWCVSAGIGRYDAKARRYLVSKTRLLAYLAGHGRTLPAA